MDGTDYAWIKEIESDLQELKKWRDEVKNTKLGFFKLNADAKIPSKAHPTDSGFDIWALPHQSRFLKPHQTTVYKTGIALSIPSGFEVQVRSRSGLAANFSISIANSPGTVDETYTGDCSIILHNHSNETKPINLDKPIAQLVLSKRWDCTLVELTELPKTDRGENGFGSTDKSR